MTDLNQKKEELRLLAIADQTKASDPSLSVWVEASAGTGKTKVLSDRVLRLLLEDINPSKILCLTYTKAAAVEMNNRIYAKLSTWSVLSDSDLIKELSDLYGTINIFKQKSDLLVKARILFTKILDAPIPLKIQTIHSFCQEILKRFPLESGISPYFEVMDEQKTNEALEELSRKILAEIEHFQSPEQRQAILFLTDNLQEFSFHELLLNLAKERNKLIKVMSAFQTQNLFLAHLRQKLGFEQEPSENESLKLFAQKIDKPMMQKCAQALLQGSKTDQEHGLYLVQSLENFDFKVYKQAFLTKDNTPLSVFAHQGAVAVFNDIEKEMSKEACRLIHQIEILKNIRIYETTKAVFIIAKRLIDEYKAYKISKSYLDYEDLIVMVKNLLEKQDIASWVLYKLDQGISHILIDEAQDTSENQWAIIRSLTNEFFSGIGQSQENRTIFAVGDRKQSIYRFQGAEPEKFDQMRNFYSHNAPHFHTVNLKVSFRSAEAVLDIVNTLFAEKEASKGLVYDGQKIEHQAFRIGSASQVTLWNIEEPLKDEKHDIWELPVNFNNKISARSKLAEKIAHKIKQMVTQKEILQSRGRPIRYKDFMILVQRRNAFVDEFIKAAKKIGVEVSGSDRLKLMDQIVIEDLISFAQFLLLPNDDLSLAEILKSPLFELDDDDLFDLCYHRQDLSLWQRLKQSAKHQNIADYLTELLNFADLARPYEIFSNILATHSGRKKFYSRLGIETKDAIDEFMNLTLQFEEEHVPNLQNFVAWIHSFKTEVKRELDQSDEDSVRIMTVHGSKGLQAPIIILPDTLREPYVRRQRGGLFENNTVYFPLSASDYNQNCEKIYQKEIDKTYDEYRRLLYVALTRAEDRLYIAGYGKSKGSGKDWFSMCQKVLQQIGIKEDNEYIFQCQQLVDVEKPKTEPEHSIQPQDTSFAYQIAPKEKALSKPYSPSHMEEDDQEPVASPLCDDGFFYKRGTVIHKILQLLHDLGIKETAHQAIKNYLSHEKDISDALKQNILTEVLNLIQTEKYAFLFSEHAKAEVPVMGIVDSKIISGQIDRLVVDKDKVIIVDFKTNRPAASTLKEIPQAYITQLKTYQQLLTQIYPSKKIETYILWTNTLKLMKI